MNDHTLLLFNPWQLSKVSYVVEKSYVMIKWNSETYATVLQQLEYRHNRCEIKENIDNDIL